MDFCSFLSCCLGSSTSVIVICYSGAHIEYADWGWVEGGSQITEWSGSVFCLESVKTIKIFETKVALVTDRQLKFPK